MMAEDIPCKYGDEDFSVLDEELDEE